MRRRSWLELMLIVLSVGILSSVLPPIELREPSVVGSDAIRHRQVQQCVTVHGIRLGMSSAQVKAILGDPGETTEDGIFADLCWSYEPQRLLVCFCGDRVVGTFSLELEVDGVIVSREERDFYARITDQLGQPTRISADGRSWSLDGAIIAVGEDSESPIALSSAEGPTWAVDRFRKRGG